MLFDSLKSITVLSFSISTFPPTKGLPVPNLVLIYEAIHEGHTHYSPRHIALLIRQGKLPGKKQGKVWLVDLDALKAYEASMTEAGTAKFDPTKNNNP